MVTVDQSLIWVLIVIILVTIMMVLVGLFFECSSIPKLFYRAGVVFIGKTCILQIKVVVKYCKKVMEDVGKTCIKLKINV